MEAHGINVRVTSRNKSAIIMDLKHLYDILSGPHICLDSVPPNFDHTSKQLLSPSLVNSTDPNLQCLTLCCAFKGIGIYRPGYLYSPEEMLKLVSLAVEQLETITTYEPASEIMDSQVVRLLATFEESASSFIPVVGQKRHSWCRRTR